MPASRPRLLFVAHVDWAHIWQRPHHLASELSRFAHVRVVHPVSRTRPLGVRHSRNPAIERAPLLRLPGSYRSGARFALNNALCAGQLAVAMARFRPDVVLVTSPECHAWVHRNLHDARLAYDCMDDALAFAQDDDVRARKAALERDLLRRADVVTCSSDALAERCRQRGAPPGRVKVIHNGWDPACFPVAPPRPLPASGPLTLGYFGTLGSWLDTATLEQLAAACDDVRIRLIGPRQTSYAPRTDRITIERPVPYERLIDAVAGCDALLLPFRVDSLTSAVDPVKLYEYVALGRPIASTWWPELARFGPFVTFFHDAAELVHIVRARAFKAAASAGERGAFLAPRSWAHRASSLAGALFPELSAPA